ncbi:MAG: cytidine deaminase [Lachnospiraceae bacterium]|nr:cytidine deaminase [Lachnospiraceae bacterium]
MEESEIKKLINMARNERLLAYSPYSGFSVGAALLCKNGEVICGCNIENASYGATNCAERTAVFKAISEGIKDFLAIAVVGGKSGEEPEDYAYPCGMCRQVLSEFCGSDFNVIVAKNTDDYKVYRLSELLPEAFKL